MKYILSILCIIFIAGCNSYKISELDLIKSEGFIGYSLANYNKNQSKKIDSEPIFDVSKIEAKTEEVKIPKKYLRLLTAYSGCPHCIHQNEVLIGSDWIIHSGTERDNEKKMPYHGLKETVESTSDSNNPLWEKYKASALPHWELVVNGKVVKVNEGYMSLNELREFYLNGDKSE